MCLNYVDLHWGIPVTYPEPKVGFKVMERLEGIGSHNSLYDTPFQGGMATLPGVWVQDAATGYRRCYLVPEDFDADYDLYSELDFIEYPTGYHIWKSGQDAIDCLKQSCERQMGQYRRDNWVVVRVEYNDVVAEGTQATNLRRVGEHDYYSGGEGQVAVARSIRVMEEYWHMGMGEEQ